MRTVRFLLTLTGIVAVGAGLFGALTGVDGMSGDSAATVNVDSEYRFLSIFWAAFGAAAIRLARAPHPDPGRVRILMLVLFCAGLARALSLVVEGRPDTLYVVLLALELGVPAITLAVLAREADSALP